MKKLFISGIIISFSLSIFNCGDDKPESSIQITNANCIIENIDVSYLSEVPSENPHLYYNFFIYYSAGSDISSIQNITVTIPDGNTILLNTIDTQNAIIGGWHRIYFPLSPNALPIGQFVAEVNQISGASASYTGIISAPGLSATDGFTSVYSEDSPEIPGATPALKRAYNLNGTKNETSITISFVTDDENIYNGTIWFYNESGEYSGMLSSYFRNAVTGELIANIDGLVTDGTTANTITIQNTDINYQTGITYESISKFIVILADGVQYAEQGLYNKFNYRSISAKTDLTSELK